MKYFRITDLTTGDEHLISSVLPNETPTHVMLSAHLDTEHKYRIEEISVKEFYGFPPKCFDFDVDEDRRR